MTIFISYARKDRAAAETLRHDLERARSSVWLDDELTGGQAWWETILGQIRSCELFVFALSPDSLRSKACQAELRYALELKRPLLPVMVRTVSVQLAPAAIADTQIIDYTERTADSAVTLVTAAANRPPAPALPDPLPVPPPPPMSYMNPYREQIQSSDLSFRDQAQIVLALRGHLQDEDERDTARGLLVELRRRQDIAESVAREVDELLASVPAAEPAVGGGRVDVDITDDACDTGAPSPHRHPARLPRPQPRPPGIPTRPVGSSSATGTAPAGPNTSVRAASRPSTLSTARRMPPAPRSRPATAADLRRGAGWLDAAALPSAAAPYIALIIAAVFSASSAWSSAPSTSSTRPGGARPRCCSGWDRLDRAEFRVLQFGRPVAATRCLGSLRPAR